MVREPAVAGQFYPGEASTLKALVAKLTRKDVKRVNALGVVSPHAGLVYSGPVAGEVFSRVNLPDVYIIIGPNHTGRGRPFSLMKNGSWATPLGEVKIDEALSADLLSHSRFLQDDPTAHAFEHSVEVQLPFIQFFKKDFKFVPIILAHADLAAYREIAANIADAIKKSKKNARRHSLGNMGV